MKVETIMKNKKIAYIIGAILLGFYVKEDDKILNFPFYVNILLYTCILTILIGYFYFFNRKKKEYNFITENLNSLVLALSLFFIIRLVAIFYIKEVADKDIIIARYPISNFISGRFNSVYFYFQNKRYSLGYRNSQQLLREDIINNYEIEIQYSHSVLNTYVIRKYKIVPK